MKCGGIDGRERKRERVEGQMEERGKEIGLASLLEHLKTSARMNLPPDWRNRLQYK